MELLFEWFGVVMVAGLASCIAALVLRSDKLKATIIGVVSAIVANMILPFIQSSHHDIDLNRKFFVSFLSAFIVLSIIKLVSKKKELHN